MLLSELQADERESLSEKRLCLLWFEHRKAEYVSSARILAKELLR